MNTEIDYEKEFEDVTFSYPKTFEELTEEEKQALYNMVQIFKKDLEKEGK